MSAVPSPLYAPPSRHLPTPPSHPTSACHLYQCLSIKTPTNHCSSGRGFRPCPSCVFTTSWDRMSFRSEPLALIQLLLPSAGAYPCMCQIGEKGLVELRDLNPGVSSFKRKFVGEILRYDNLEHTLRYLYEEVTKEGVTVLGDEVSPKAPSPRDALDIQSRAESLQQELLEVTRNCDSLTADLVRLNEYQGLLGALSTFLLPLTPSSPSPGPSEGIRMSSVYGIIATARIPSFELLLWRCCCGFTFLHHEELPQTLVVSQTEEPVKRSVFMISYWGERIGEKVQKICQSFHGRILQCPESLTEREKLLSQLESQITEIKTVLTQTEQYRHQLLTQASCVVWGWLVQARKAKAAYHALSLCRSDLPNVVVGEAWVPVSVLPCLDEALSKATEFLQERATYSHINARFEDPPSLLSTNQFTSAFQNIINAYGVASYRELNPAPFTIVTFPFLFAVMFGDFGHGVLMVAFALALLYAGKSESVRHSTNEILSMIYGGRFVLLLMGLFSIYTGLIYNECFSHPVVIFPSSWNVSAMSMWSQNLNPNSHLTLDPTVSGVFNGPYPFGIDPIWSMATNKLNFLNSYKMKMSILIGIPHMGFGLFLSLLNQLHFHHWLDIWCVVLPQLLFLFSLFGYLCLIVVFKWVFWLPANSQNAPSLLLGYIHLFMFQGDKQLYSTQIQTERGLAALGYVCVPWLLFSKPIAMYISHHRRKRRSLMSLQADDSPLLTEFSDGFDDDPDKIEFDFADEFMLQAIHTIEFCLGCISNTASYLRLWALSLAHAELSNVLWTMVLHYGLSATGVTAPFLLVPCFCAFFCLTVAILLVMEGLSAFLHALRLHWVEFQNKFYHGDGRLFSPFSFKLLLNSQEQITDT
uniref:V-type proton ATPase 116 kDa subunit a1-like isoform X1 n=2 Tax=Myxine glutinosa TaxID=7769 RepID=UPI00359022A8